MSKKPVVLRTWDAHPPLRITFEREDENRTFYPRSVRFALCVDHPWRVPVIPAILTPMVTERLNLHLVSDATGETLNSIARATVSQFEHVSILYHRWSLVRTRFQLHRVLEGIEAEPGPVLSTLLDAGLREELARMCDRLELTVVNVLDPVMGMLQEELGAKAAARPGRQYVLDADYFRRIDAIALRARP